MSKGVIVYGTDECEDTRETRQYLEGRAIPYQYVNVEKDPAARKWVLDQNDGEQKTPTVDVSGFILSEPSNGELDAALRRQGVVPRLTIEAHDPPSAPLQ
jgi:glutaredoxin